MSDSNIAQEFATAEAEPLLPIELTLIRWSLGVGLALLVVLGGAGKFIFPA